MSFDPWPLALLAALGLGGYTWLAVQSEPSIPVIYPGGAVLALVVAVVFAGLSWRSMRGT